MLLRKLFRTAFKYKSQFISMILMLAIGAGVFMGFNMEWYSLEKDTLDFLEETKYADYRIYSEEGFSADDIEKIQSIDGVKAANRVLAVNVDVKDTKKSLVLFVPEEYTVSTMLINEGEEFDSDSEGFWLSDKYAKANNIEIGDTLTVTYLGKELTANVRGFGKSGEYMICVADENQLMPDLENFGFVYASPKLMQEAVGIDYYPQINIISDMSKTDIENEIGEQLGKTTLVLTKDEHISYAGAMGEVEEGKTMGALIPVLFLAIAILTMITTMHRITANEKTQIGTLKALGFKDRRILRHYTSYGFILGIMGAVLGVILGYYVGGLVLDEEGMMGTYIDMPSWKLYMPAVCWLVLVLMVVLQTFIGYLSVKKMLRGTAAEALRPYTPKKIKPMKIEKTAWWNRRSFSTKWNMRDVVRHKSRSLMTLIGIIGCMLLMVGGLGMKDTMAEYLDLIEADINNYNTKVNIAETADNKDTEKFAQEKNADWQASLSVKLDDEAVTLDIYDVNNDMIKFINEENECVELEDDGAYICIRLADNINVGDTISFSPYGSDKSYSVKVAGVIRSVASENITITKEYAQKLGIPYHIGAVYTNESLDEIESEEFIAGKQSKQAIMDTYDSFMEIMNLMVAIFVVGAIVLGTVVLYNLGVMSYVERSRELATLKVVGFKDRHMTKILISQNIWLTVIGVAVGIPAGIGVLIILLEMLGRDYELDLTVGAPTYIISVSITFGVSLIVGYFVAKKNKNIDMVEALKGAE